MHVASLAERMDERAERMQSVPPALWSHPAGDAWIKGIYTDCVTQDKLSHPTQNVWIKGARRCPLTLRRDCRIPRGMQRRKSVANVGALCCKSAALCRGCVDSC